MQLTWDSKTNYSTAFKTQTNKELDTQEKQDG